MLPASYPSYPLKFWNFPGIGQFQCYDRYMRRDLVRTAIKAGKPDLGLVWPPHPHDVGNYNYSSDHTQFFRDGGLWETPEADFFLVRLPTSLSHVARVHFVLTGGHFPSRGIRIR